MIKKYIDKVMVWQLHNRREIICFVAGLIIGSIMDWQDINDNDKAINNVRYILFIYAWMYILRVIFALHTNNK